MDLALTPPTTARGPAEGEARIVTGPLPLQAAVDALRDPSGRVGAVVTFTGLVRAAGHERAVAALEFECYPEMAAPELEAIRQEGLRRHGLAGLTILHRTGRLLAGEDIVLVVAAGAHRREAFAAAAWAMDEVKRRVPLWKREVDADGRGHWVAGDSCRCAD